MKVFLVVLLAAFASADLAPLLKKGNDKVEGQYIVKMKKGFRTSFFENRQFFSLGGDILRKYSNVFEGFSAKLSEKALNFVLNSGVVEYVEEDSKLYAATAWGLDRIDQKDLPLDGSFAAEHGGNGINVYVIDSGIEESDFDNDRAHSDFDAYDGDGSDCAGHGKYVARIIGANTYGVANEVTIHGVRVLDCDGTGTVESVTAGIDWITSNLHTPAVASLAFSGEYSSTLDSAVGNLFSECGVVTVAAAGNGPNDACSYSPAGEATAITVGATDITDARASFSNYGVCLDVFAPGDNIPVSPSETVSGTSYAAAHVVGIIASLYEEVPTEDALHMRTHFLEDVSMNKLSSLSSSCPNKLAYLHGATDH